MEKLVTMYLRMKNAKAEGIMDTKTQEITVKKGAVLEKEVADSFFDHTYYKLRQKLIASPIVEDYILIDDFTFNSLSAAAAVIGGRAAAGPKEWKSKEGFDANKVKELYDRFYLFKTYVSENRHRDLDMTYIKEIEYFKTKFPKNQLNQLTLEQYDKKGSRTSFTYLLEHGTKRLSGGFFYNNNNKLFYEKNDAYVNSEFIASKYPHKTVRERFDIYKNDLYKLVNEFDESTYVTREYDVLPIGANFIKSKLINI
ncbi:DUF4357 domain-containing protein, partial [Liberiplasma polymorphum]|uniref:DUF4357 domain-containing protein n=1 Tax=Liberiplasma polymorphum TaxID=3374570 RepID=UPI00377392E0